MCQQKRGAYARFDDLSEVLQVIAATILVGIAPNVLNIPDQVKKLYKHKLTEFQQSIFATSIHGLRIAVERICMGRKPEPRERSCSDGSKVLSVTHSPPWTHAC